MYDTTMKLYATPMLVVKWWTQVQVYSCMRIKSHRLIKSLHSISNMTYVGLAPDYWLAPSLVLKLCQYYQVGMVLTWLQVRV